MNTQASLVRAGLLGLALSLSAIGARAEESAKPAEKPVPPAALKRFDKDGDGVLNTEEKAAWKAARENERKAMLEKYDTDKDGKLSDEEKAAAKADREKKAGKPKPKPQE
jgi:hypothetical protein